MMRTNSLLASLACLILFGCLTQPGRDGIAEKVDTGFTQIEIAAVQNVNITRHAYKWTLEKNGKSYGSIHRTDFVSTCTELDLPPTAYNEFLAMIEKTQFFQMKSASAPSVPFEIPLRIIRVRSGGQEHVVTQKGEVEIDPGFDEMWALIRKIENRSVQETPGSRKRVVTGLTPAGPPLP